MEKVILTNDVNGLSIGGHINKLLQGHDRKTIILCTAVLNDINALELDLPHYWHSVHALVTGDSGIILRSQEGEGLLRAVHRNRKTYFEHSGLGSWSDVVQMWSRVSLVLTPQLKAIIPTANDATDGKMDLWLTGAEKPVNSSNIYQTFHGAWVGGWVQMANFLLFNKIIELHSSDFEHKLLRCYGPTFQAEDKRTIRDTLATLDPWTGSRH
jgi:hypothetical protein